MTAVPDVVAWVVSLALAVAVADLVSPLSMVDIVGAVPPDPAVTVAGSPFQPQPYLSRSRYRSGT
jgi:hypothetical protein